MRKSRIYGIDVPELEDEADVIVISNAIDLAEEVSVGSIEAMSGFIYPADMKIELDQPDRTAKRVMLPDGITVQFTVNQPVTVGMWSVEIDGIPVQWNVLKEREADFSITIQKVAGEMVQVYHLHDEYQEKSPVDGVAYGLKNGELVPVYEPGPTQYSVERLKAPVRIEEVDGEVQVLNLASTAVVTGTYELKSSFTSEYTSSGDSLQFKFVGTIISPSFYKVARNKNEVLPWTYFIPIQLTEGDEFELSLIAWIDGAGNSDVIISEASLVLQLVD